MILLKKIYIDSVSSIKSSHIISKHRCTELLNRFVSEIITIIMNKYRNKLIDIGHTKTGVVNWFLQVLSSFIHCIHFLMLSFIVDWLESYSNKKIIFNVMLTVFICLNDSWSYYFRASVSVFQCILGQDTKW